MFCSQHLESIHGGSDVEALGSNKTCAHILEGHKGVRFEIS
jgi:hypothetical protein